MKAKEIYKVTYQNGNTSFIHALSLGESKMKAYDQTGEEFREFGLPTTVEEAEPSEVENLDWYRYQEWKY